MSEPGYERPDSTPSSATKQEEVDPSEERRLLSYDGSRVPFYIVLIWLVFFVWGLVYFVRWIPESWREWFAR